MALGYYICKTVSVIKPSSERRLRLKEELFAVIDRMAPETAAELAEELALYPYPELSNEQRAHHLLVREGYKLMNDAQIRKDGNVRAPKKAALGMPCPFCAEPMTELSLMEVDHECYDGRPPRPVHTACHKKHQPH